MALQIDAVRPDVLVWNGDTCDSAFDAPADAARVLLSQEWASTRPLVFVPGNHDVRGACARGVRDCLAAGPDASLPYEPYRARQAVWLGEALARPEIASAPFKAVFCHIPLHGLPQQNDGLSLKGFAEWSGDGARNWMPALREVGVQLVVSGHKHAWRMDEAAYGEPLQIVVGGTDPRRGQPVTLTPARKRLIKIGAEVTRHSNPPGN